MADLSTQQIDDREVGLGSRVVFLIRSLDVGGAERQLVMLAKELKARGTDIHVLTFFPAGVLRAELEAADVPVYSLGKCGRWDVPGFILRLFRQLRHLRPSVLYSWLSTANTLAATVGRLARVSRVVWGVRASNIDFSHYDWLHRVDFAMTRFVSRWADRIICNSEAGRNFHEKLGYSHEKLVVVENGIDTERFRFDPEGRARLRGEWNIDAGETLIGLVARLDPMKGHETFLHAAALLRHKRQNVRFLCIGDGPPHYLVRLRALTDELGISDRVIWAGRRSDLSAVYSALDVSCSSSSFGEGFSNAIAESMACERPCVVTDVGDSARIVVESGWVVPPSNAQKFAEALLTAVRLPEEKRWQLGSAARRRIVQQFSTKKMVEKTLAEFGLV